MGFPHAEVNDDIWSVCNHMSNKGVRLVMFDTHECGATKPASRGMHVDSKNLGESSVLLKQGCGK